jgi:hypothetical protein
MQTGETIGYGYVREVALEFEEAVTKIEAALSKHSNYFQPRNPFAGKRLDEFAQYRCTG